VPARRTFARRGATIGAHSRSKPSTDVLIASASRGVSGTALAACAAVLALVGGACGGPNDSRQGEQAPDLGSGPTSTDTGATTTVDSGDGEGNAASVGTTDQGVATVRVTLDDYIVVIDRDSASAETITFSVANRGSVQHDLAVIATELALDRLPTSGIRVDEENPQIDIVARTPTVRPGGVASVRVSLATGGYVLACTVPHHYVREKMATKFSAV
jgi:hypothetical protein